MGANMRAATTAATAAALILASFASPITVKAATTTASSIGVCAELSATIDADQMELSSLDNDNLLEDSAPRATMRNVAMNEISTRTNGNLSLMEQHHCVPYPHALTNAAFLINAVMCNTATMEVTLGKRSQDEAKSVCDRSKWSRSATSPVDPEHQ
jgi:hypothetical protein